MENKRCKFCKKTLYKGRYWGDFMHKICNIRFFKKVEKRRKMLEKYRKELFMIRNDMRIAEYGHIDMIAIVSDRHDRIYYYPRLYEKTKE